MKVECMITKEATKYWKKAIRRDRVMVCREENNIYVLNGYNAFIFPAVPLIWETLAQPAFMVDMPAPGTAFQYFRGEKQWASVEDIVAIFNRQLSDETPATRTAFIFDTGEKILRLYKNGNGNISGVDAAYDLMVDHSQVKEIYCGGRYSPVVLKNDYITALIMPVRMCGNFPDQVRDTFEKLL